MSKYGKYTGGQVEAVLNMIGGETVIDNLLVGKVQVFVKKVEPPVQERTTAVCEVFNGNRCTICGGFFGEGDDICSCGHHIGLPYSK